MDSPISAFSVYKNDPNLSRPLYIQSIKRKKLVPRKTAEKIANNVITKKKQEKKVVVVETVNSKTNDSPVKEPEKKVKKLRDISSLTSPKRKSPIAEQKLPLAKLMKKGLIKKNRQSVIALNKATETPVLSKVEPIPKDVDDFAPILNDSAEEGKKLFAWLISPLDLKDFFENIWEKKPIHLARKNSLYYGNIISTPIIDNMLRTENILFTKNIDVTSYTNGKRETHNPVGRAHPHVVWDYYLNGCSVRLLNPQTYIPRLHLLNATMQEYFNSFVGANAYLTPPDSQGFAPHYDDIEAFIMQIEGKKHWKVYKPLSEEEVLPRVSSRNFDESEIGKPVLEVTLQPGDLLYFPRGYIHQGVTVAGEHSLHVTVSFYQSNSWADLLEKLLPNTLQNAISKDIEFRKGLPLDIYDHFGMVNSKIYSARRTEIKNKIKSLLEKLQKHLTIDSAVDEVNKNFQHDALPPVLSEHERALTVFGDGDLMTENGKVIHRVELEMDTRVRLLRKNILRMVTEDNSIKIYFYNENSLEYHANEPQFLEIDEFFTSAIETLVRAYPEYVTIEHLGLENDSDKIQVANDLWEKGILMTEFPLENLEDD